MPHVKSGKLRALGVLGGSRGPSAAPSTPAKFDKQIREDFVRWGKVVKQSGAKVD